MFDTVFEMVEATVKAYYLAGKVSIDDLNCIFEKYGIAWQLKAREKIFGFYQLSTWQ